MTAIVWPGRSLRLDCRRLSPVPTEHHVQRHEKEERAKYLSEDVSFNLRGDDGTDRRTEEESERQQACNRKVYVTCAIVADRCQKADGR